MQLRSPIYQESKINWKKQLTPKLKNSRKWKFIQIVPIILAVRSHNDKYDSQDQIYNQEEAGASEE